MKVQVTCKEKETGTPRGVTFDVDYGEDLAAATEKYGDKVIFDYFLNTARLKVQGVARAKLTAGGTDEEAIAAGEAFVPGTIVRQSGGGSAIKKLVGQVKAGKMSRQELIDLLSKELEEEDEAE